MDLLQDSQFTGSLPAGLPLSLSGWDTFPADGLLTPNFFLWDQKQKGRTQTGDFSVVHRPADECERDGQPFAFSQRSRSCSTLRGCVHSPDKAVLAGDSISACIWVSYSRIPVKNRCLSQKKCLIHKFDANVTFRLSNVTCILLQFISELRHE